MTALVAPPTETRLPVTRGCGRALTVEYRDPATGQRATWPAGSTVSLHAEGVDPLPADMVAYNATITLPAQVCDQLKTNTRFRVILSFGALQLPLLVGRIVRFDG